MHACMTKCLALCICFVRDNAANEMRTHIYFQLRDQYFDRKYNVIIQHVLLHVVNGKYPVREKNNNSYIYLKTPVMDLVNTLSIVYSVHVCMVIYHCKVQSTI